ncbi:MAG: Hpt domain-containing protein [bacterium]
MKTRDEEKVKDKENIAQEQGKGYNYGGCIIDWQNVWDRIEDEELIKEIAIDFLSENTERMKMLGLAINSMDLKRIIFYVHAIKGSASSIAAKEVTEAAYELELASNKNERDRIEPLFDALKKKFDALTALLSIPDWIEKVKS